MNYTINIELTYNLSIWILRIIGFLYNCSSSSWSFKTNVIIHDTLEGAITSSLSEVNCIFSLDKLRAWDINAIQPVQPMNPMSCNRVILSYGSCCE
jgi:hypothetical protein